MISRIKSTNFGPLVAIATMLAVVSITSVAMSDAVYGESDNENYVGTRDKGSVIALAAPVKSVNGNPAPWGVFAYQSDRGLTCLQAGLIRDGQAGAYTEKGFRAFSPGDSVGSCGELSSAVASEGGIVFASEAPASSEVSDRTGVIYGLVDERVERVSVTIEGTSESIPVEFSQTTEVDGADRAFVAPLPARAKLPGATIIFEQKGGEKTKSTI